MKTTLLVQSIITWNCLFSSFCSCIYIWFTHIDYWKVKQNHLIYVVQTLNYSTHHHQVTVSELYEWYTLGFLFVVLVLEVKGFSVICGKPQSHRADTTRLQPSCDWKKWNLGKFLVRLCGCDCVVAEVVNHYQIRSKVDGHLDLRFQIVRDSKKVLYDRTTSHW